MKIYLLSYELRSADKDYTPLYEFLEKAGNDRLHVLRDSWWIASSENMDIDGFCQNIRSFINQDTDVFYFSEMSVTHINGWLASSSWNWYREQKNR